jgi:hypothetical protein
VTPVTERPAVLHEEPPITWYRVFELASASAASWALALLAITRIPAFKAWTMSGDLQLILLTLALGIGVMTGLFLGLLAASRRGTGSPDGPERQWFRQFLHFAPALLLAFAWWTSGLEQGAVLILSILVVAVLVLRAIPNSRNS